MRDLDVVPRKEDEGLLITLPHPELEIPTNDLTFIMRYLWYDNSLILSSVVPVLSTAADVLI